MSCRDATVRKCSHRLIKIFFDGAQCKYLQVFKVFIVHLLLVELPLPRRCSVGGLHRAFCCKAAGRVYGLKIASLMLSGSHTSVGFTSEMLPKIGGQTDAAQTHSNVNGPADPARYRLGVTPTGGPKAMVDAQKCPAHSGIRMK